MFFSYSKRIFFLSFLALSIFLQSTPAIAMEEKTLRRIDLQTKPRCISEHLDIFYENTEKFEDLIECNQPFVSQSFKWLEEEYAKEDGNPKAKLIYFFTRDRMNSMWGDKRIQDVEWQKVYEWLESQRDDPAALHWLGKFHERQYYTNRDAGMDVLYKAEEFYIKALKKGFSASCNSLGDLYDGLIYYGELKVQGLQGHEPEAKTIGANCFKKAQEYFLQGSQSKDTTTRYHAYKSLMEFYIWHVNRRHYHPELNSNKAVYWCIKILDILPDYFLSRLCLSDLMSENQKILRACLFPKELVLYKLNQQQSAADVIVIFKHKLEQKWLEAFENLKSISLNTSLENAKNEFKIIYNEEAKDREYYEKFSFLLEEAVRYLPLALEKDSFTFMIPQIPFHEHLRNNFSVYDPMNPASSDELALRVYPMGYGDITIAFGNENVQFCDKVMDILEGPCSLSSLINHHQQEIQRLESHNDLAEIIKHTMMVDNLQDILKNFKGMLMVTNPAKVEQFKLTYGFLADMFD